METFLDKHRAIIEANERGERVKPPQSSTRLIIPICEHVKKPKPVPTPKKIKISKPCKPKRIKGERQKIVELIAEKKSYGCSICGYNRCKASLDFHHINPKTKSFALSKAADFFLDKVILELDKCILVCANCHGEIHAGITSI